MSVTSKRDELRRPHWNAKRKLDITTFGSTTELTEPEHAAQTWGDFTNQLAKRPPTAPRKEQLKLFKLCRFGSTRNPNGAGSYRHNGNVLHLSGIVAEHDAGTMSLDEAAKLLKAAGVASFLYTSPSHTAERPRWRVLTPLAVDTSPDQHTALVDRLNGALGGALAGESWTLTQIFYYGKVEAEGVVYDTRLIEGLPLDLVTGITPIGKKGQPVAEQKPHVGIPALNADVSTRSADLDYLRKLLAQRDPDCDEPEWWRLAAILSHETGHSDEGYELFDAWSAKGMKYEGPEDTRRKWDQIGQRGDVANPATAGSLRREAIADDADFGPPLTEKQRDDVLAAAEAAEQRKRDEQVAQFQWRSVDWIVSQPDPEWLIFQIVPVSFDLVFFAGVPGAGKSFLALDAALAVVRGVPWFGADTKQATVGYIAAEAFGTFQTRLRAYLKRHDLQPSDIAGFKLLGAGINLANKEQIAALGESAKSFAPKLLIVDTLAAAAGGLDHNSSEMQSVIDGCKHLQRATGATVLVVAHHGKDETKGIMGWTGLTAAAETICAVTKSEDETMRTRHFKVMKQRNGREGISYAWQLEEVALGDDAAGHAVESAVPRFLGLGSRETAKRKRLGKNAQPAFDVIFEHDGELTVDEALVLIVPRLTAPEDGKEDRRRDRARDAVNSLISKRAVELRDGKLRIYIEQTPEQLLAAAPASSDLNEETI